MYYVMSLKSGTIIDIYDSLLEAKELVSEYPQWTIMIKYDDRHCEYAEIKNGLD